MFEIFFLIYLGYKNNIRAKAKGLNGIAWAVYTGISYLVAYIIGLIFVVVFVLRNKLYLGPDAVRSQYEDLTNEMSEQLKANPMLIFTVYFIALGGYLFIRYLIDRKQGKTTEPAHWMDKLNNESQQN